MNKNVKLQAFDAAVFDMDGTLLNSMQIWDELVQDYLRTLGEEPYESLRVELRPLNMEQTAQLIREKYRLPHTVAQLIDGINALGLEKYRADATPKAGIQAYLQSLQAAGIPMVAATATDRVVAEPILAELGLLPYFTALLTCTEEGVDKSTPAIYKKGMRLAGVQDTNRCAVFEDALHCIHTVKDAGFYTVAVQDASAAYAWEEICATADAYISDFTELL